MDYIGWIRPLSRWNKPTYQLYLRSLPCVPHPSVWCPSIVSICFIHLDDPTASVQQRQWIQCPLFACPAFLSESSFVGFAWTLGKRVIRNGQTWQFSLWQWQSNRPMHANHEGWWSMVESSSYIQKNAARLQAPKCQPWTRSKFLFICFMNILMNLSDHNATVVLLHSIPCKNAHEGGGWSTQRDHLRSILCEIVEV